MTAADWPRIRDLFEQALESGGADPRGWLEQQADVDPPLRDEVLALLAHDAMAGTFLECPPEIPDTPLLEPGRTIGPYRIVRQAGQGGAGRVYVALDTRLGRSVALKALRSDCDRPEQRERLRREAQAAAALTHPGICTVYALEDLEGDLYIASELIEGRTLRQELVADSHPARSRLLEQARELATALAAAHSAGLVHGDLKPENVMRTYAGRLKILDFGLARLEKAASGGLDATSLGGTPGYMAPERINGQAGDVRSDVFAFGVLMYEYATGVHPFQAATLLATAHRVLEDEPAPLDTLRRDIGDPLRAVIERCLSKAPSDRFASAMDLLRALPDPSGAPALKAMSWWRVHHLIVIGLYTIAAVAAWQVMTWSGGMSATLFLAVGVAATTAAIFRGHLLFTDRLTGATAAAERQRAAPITLILDLLIGLALGVDSFLIAQARPVPAVLIAALAVGLVLARLVLEPSTSRAAFRR